MMIGHLTFAGLAEAVIAGGLVAYLQVADPALLRGTAGVAADSADTARGVRAGSLSRLWIAVAALMLITPLGILAAGKAWGEWSPAELSKMPSSSATAVAPAGLQKLSSLWTAPFPAYAPAFVKSSSFGYLLSAIFGVGLLLAISLLAQRLLRSPRTERS